MRTLIDALKGLLSRMEADPFQAPCHEQSLREIIAEHERITSQQETSCTLGVGDGSGKLFVHGSYEAIKIVQQAMLGEHERSAEPVKCKCGSEPNADHPCPYKSEINDNSEDLCNCCDDCRHNCCMDI